MATTKNILLFLILLSVLPSTAAVVPPAASLLSAANTLSNSDYISIARALRHAASSGLGIDSLNATVFLPPDAAFFQLPGSPSLPLHYISPTRLSLKSLARGTKIKTLRRNFSLTVTSSSSYITEGFTAIDGVRVYPNSFFEDGYVVVYRVAGLFDIKIGRRVSKWIGILRSQISSERAMLHFSRHVRRSAGPYNPLCSKNIRSIDYARLNVILYITAELVRPFN